MHSPNTRFVILSLACLCMAISGSAIANSACPGDANHDATTDTEDLLLVLAAYGDCQPACGCQGDLNASCAVDVNDLLLVLAGWGPCASCGDSGAGNCFVVNGSQSCDSTGCCITVCSYDPFCCDSNWDSVCVYYAEAWCDPYGACCLAGGLCELVTDEGACTELGGNFQGYGTICSEIECDPCGLGDDECCVPGELPGCSDPVCCDAVCAVDSFCCSTQWDFACAAQAETMCSSCNVTGACCFSTGACQVLSELDCSTAGGDFSYGPGSSCQDVLCLISVGACCDGGSCIMTTPANCTSIGGEFQGLSSSCSSVECEPVSPFGACCLGNGFCLDSATPGDCSELGGSFLGAGTDCDPNPCN